MSGGDRGSEDVCPLNPARQQWKARASSCRVVTLSGSLGQSCPSAEGPADSPCVSMGDAASSDTRLFSRGWVPGRNKPLTGTVTCLGHFMSPDPEGLGGEDWGQKGRCRSIVLGPLTSLGLRLLLRRASIITAPASGASMELQGMICLWVCRAGGRGQAP